MANETPYARAMKKYRESPEFREASDITTLLPGANPKYLENRLMLAFQFGWNTRALHERENKDG